MIIEKINFAGVYILKPKIFNDERGFFFESFNQKKFNELTGLNINFVQDNIAKSKKNVLRGLHFQKEKHAQAKLVSVLKGKVLDVIVDLRKNSNTFGKFFSIILSEENKLQLFVPRGFAHGYLSLENNTIFHYKVDNYYHKESESGINYKDKTLNIDWKKYSNDFIVSEKDNKLVNHIF